MNAEVRRNLESTMIGLGYKTVSLKELLSLLSPPPKHTNTVVQTVMTFLGLVPDRRFPVRRVPVRRDQLDVSQLDAIPFGRVPYRRKL